MSNDSETTERRIREALEASEAGLRLVLEASGTGLWTWEPASDVVTWSREAYLIHGFMEGEFGGTGTAFFRLVHPDDRERVEATVRTAIAEGQLYECEFRILRPDGSLVWVANRGRALMPTELRPLTVVGTITDISARKREEQMRRTGEDRLRLALEASNAGVWEWTIASAQLYWSAESYALYGVPPGERPARFADWARNVDPADLARLQYAIDRMAEGQQLELREQLRVQNGERGQRWVLAVGRLELGVDQRPARITGLYFDITESKSLEEALKDADRQKDRFLAVLSHELRNPLASIRSAVNLLADDRVPIRVNLAARDIVQRQVRHMALLLDDLLDVARIVQGKLTLHFERVYVGKLIDSAIEPVRQLIESKQHQLFVHKPIDEVALWGDELRLTQVVSNLLANAAKYTDPGGVLEVSAACQGKWLCLSVSDNGMGLPKEDLARVFTLFAQAEGSASRSDGGMGIGLALVKGIVDLHSGFVEAYSEGRGLGCRFTLYLPRLEDDSIEPGRKNSAQGSTNRAGNSGELRATPRLLKP